MFKFFFNMQRLASPSSAAWQDDPLQHPLLRDMSLRDLADLPFVPEPGPDISRPAAMASRLDCRH